MNEFLSFFEYMPIWQRAVWVVFCLSANWLVELGFPLFKYTYNKWKHAGVNLIFLGTTMLINALFGLVAVGVFSWMLQNEFGLLYLIELPLWVELLIAILVFELIAQYLVHYLLHRVKWMWRLHMVHHSDIRVDATTGTRHHPGDFILREFFALIAVLITGAPLAFYLFYRICTVFCTYLTHANIRVPVWLDRPLSYIFITPNVHKFHHHYERPWTDTNFGNILSIWDRLFGTFVYDDPRKIHYGLDVLDEATSGDVKYQFKLPFDKTVKTDY